MENTANIFVVVFVWCVVAFVWCGGNMMTAGGWENCCELAVNTHFSQGKNYFKEKLIVTYFKISSFEGNSLD